MSPDYFDDDHHDDDDEGFDDLDSCMLRPDGQCGNAGSEWCDFSCPMRDSAEFAGSAAWRKKHERKPKTGARAKATTGDLFASPPPLSTGSDGNG